MTIDEAIKHCEEVAEEQEWQAYKSISRTDDERMSCIECASEHRQLVELLRELRAYREAVKEVKEYASIWMEWNEGMSKHEIAEKAVTDAKEGFIAIVEKHLTEVNAGERDRLINALDNADRINSELKPCDDCISREAVKKLKKYCLSYDTNTTIPKSDIFVKIADIEELSSVQPQRPKGKWIDDSEVDSYYSNCSCCGYQIDMHYERGYLNYCPNCGADMRGENNG